MCIRDRDRDGKQFYALTKEGLVVDYVDK